VDMARRHYGIMLGAFTAMWVVGEMLGARLRPERVPDGVDHLLVRRHGRGTLPEREISGTPTDAVPASLRGIVQ
ncbi:MAG TPA: hypothetical protein VLK82_02800, partial [Candidatus Tectomicrobia bacterium]|nr:hypothetical protein [Candidatus Tectomicrobia bacterium]